MACAQIGDADADIAGIGVVSAFAFQSVASFILSVILDVVLRDPLNHESLHTIRPVRRSIFGITSLGDEIRKIEQDLTRLSHQVKEKAHHFRSSSTVLASLREDTQRYLQDFRQTVLSQEVPQKLLQENIYERSPRQEARSIVADILYMSSDTQTLAG
ncbi:hypothetical protein MMC14_000839 [Varicellaria rhodocarpa]|nr:hypothetical protein [Varicellaria rhodocarpa]